jgi:predicted enzyme related to lactoylglutathione lyase
MLKKSDPIVFVATNNATNARKFYEKILGLTFVSDDQFALVFDANGTMLRIQKVDNVSPQKFTVLGWRVADISDEVDALSKRGVRFERYDGMNQNESGIWMAPSKAKIAWFKDPDGNVLSLTEFAEG